MTWKLHTAVSAVIVTLRPLELAIMLAVLGWVVAIMAAVEMIYEGNRKRRLYRMARETHRYLPPELQVLHRAAIEDAGLDVNGWEG